MSHGSAVHAGSWTLETWLRKDFWEELDVRITHVPSGKRAIVLVKGPWVCGGYSFRDSGSWLDLTLCKVGGTEKVIGTFDMSRGIWKPEKPAGPELSAAEWHRLYAGKEPPGPWPDGPQPSGSAAHPKTK